MIIFDMVVVGSGGGPDETNLSAYLLKPRRARWEDGVLALEAGSGQGALNQLLQRNPHLFDSPSDLDDHEPRVFSASEIYNLVRCYLITHAHLDHINSLVVSAGSFGAPRKRVYSTKQTLQDLELLFSDRIWPNLASWNEEDDSHKLLYSILRTDNKYKSIFPDVSVRTLPLNHGRNESGHYESAAFFIRHEPSSREFLFFGDVEPDILAEKPQTIHVWRAAAPKIPDTLSSIFIECSWPSGREDETLYGHLTPEHLVDELTTLAGEVVRFRSSSQPQPRARPARKRQKKNPPSTEDLRSALHGVRVFIMHCKDDVNGVHDRPVRDIIVEQVRDLVVARGLGADILGAVQGMHIEI